MSRAHTQHRGRSARRIVATAWIAWCSVAMPAWAEEAAPADPAAAQATPAPEGLAAPAPVAQPATAPAGRVYVVHFPEEERARIREEIRQEVLSTITRENWLEAGAVPGWMRRVRFSGEFRLRGQGDFLDDSNHPAINFQAINAGAPVDIYAPAGGTPQKVLTIPYLNTTENRNALKLRAALYIETDMDERIDVGMRLATGSSSNPVSTTHTLGHDFNKASFLLDRAWVRYQSQYHAMLTGGRMDNPWQTHTDLLWDRDLGLDGLALRLKPAISGGLNPWVVLGAFSYGNTEANYPSASPFKEASNDQWLLGAQAGVRYRISRETQWRGVAALYDFGKVDGRLSSPCYAPSDKVPCNTDDSRAGALQKGNTLFAIRQLNLPNPATDPQFQYFGLASDFRVLSLGVGLDHELNLDIGLRADLEFAHNLAFDAADIRARVPVNNLAFCPATNPACVPDWTGGGSAWQAQVRVGHAKVTEAGRWEALFGYRYVESDAVLDAFTDSDFHLGGTNARGFYAGGSWGLRHNTAASLKYMSAREVGGFHFVADVLQLDLQVKF